MIERRDITRNSTSCRHSYIFFCYPYCRLKVHRPIFFPWTFWLIIVIIKSINEWEKCVYLKACRMYCPIPMGIGSKNI